MRNIVCIGLLAVIMPSVASASILIHEVAWMGDLTSANHEWIELFNESSNPVTVDGWTISDGMNLEITLNGVVSANDFAVLERTSEESAPGAGFLIYTGALVNTGATLTLSDANGTVVDQVAGGENWEQIGGDNSTKETAQYTIAGWVTDSATPGNANASGRVEDQEDTGEMAEDTDEEEETTAPKANKVSKSSRGETVRLTVSDAVLKLVPGMQKVVYVNQSTSFSVLASNIGEHIIDSLVYTWNFGDTYTKVGKSVEHAYAYPGTYVVTVQGLFGRHDQVVRQEITVLPVNFSLTKNTDGDIQINNDAPYDIDISGYILQGSKSVVMPKNTIVVAKGTITIAAKRLEDGVQIKTVALYDQVRALVATTASYPLVLVSNENRATEQTALPVLATLPFLKTEAKAKETISAAAGPFNFVAALETVVVPEVMAAGVAGMATTATTAAVMESTTTKGTEAATGTVASGAVIPGDKQWPYIALIGLLGIALLALVLQPKKPVTPAPFHS